MPYKDEDLNRSPFLFLSKKVRFYFDFPIRIRIVIAYRFADR